MSDSSGVAALGQVLPALTVLVALLLAARWWARRGHGTRPGMKVLSRTSLTRSSIVAVVEVDDRRFLVGGGDQQLTLLAELDGGTARPSTDDVTDLTDDPGIHVPDDLSSLLDGVTTTAPLPGRERLTLGPRNGLLDQLRAMTVRSHVERPPRGRPR